MTSKSILSFVLLITFLGSRAQQNFCSLLPNGNFSSTNYAATRPFTSGLVNNWTASHGQPWLNPINPLSDSASPEIEAEVTAFLEDIGSGIKTATKLNFKPGKKYYVVFNYKNNGGIMVPSLNAALVADISWGTVGNTLPIAGLTGLHNIGSLAVPSSAVNWTKQVFCFTAPAQKLDLWFYALGTRTGVGKVGIDDVEIYEDFDFAGSPKIRYTCDSTVHLGLKPFAPCVPINSVPNHKWYTTTNSTVIANTQWLDVYPSVSTSYIVERDNGGCITKDTIRVIVAAKPVFSFPADTILCQCQHISIVPNIIDYDGCLEFKWEDGSTTIPRIIGQLLDPDPTLSKRLTLTVTNRCTGCSTSKSMTITYKPVPNCIPRTIYVCEAELPQTIETTGQGTSYAWTTILSGMIPSLPKNGGRTFSIKSVGTYICAVTDLNGRCTTGYDTLHVLPWDSIKLKIHLSSYDPCQRTLVRMYNQYDPSMELNWYKDGIFQKKTGYFTTTENGTYTAEYPSPQGLCLRRDTVVIRFIDPPIVYLPQKYGSFCKKECDTILSFNYCDTCSAFMGTVTNITWSGPGVTSRIEGGINNYYFCARKAKCGNNLLTATLTYTRFGIICVRDFYTSAFKVCPLDLDSIPPICENDNDVYLHDQGNLVFNATISGNGVYHETGTGYFKFSPSTAGPGLHTIIYYYSDSAGCSGWDSISVLVLNTPILKMRVQGDGWCELKLRIESNNTDAYYNGAYTITSNLIGNYTLPSGTVRNTLINQMKPIQPDVLYWVKICNDLGCCEYKSYIYHTKEHFQIRYDSTECLTQGIRMGYYNEGELITSTTHPSSIAYIWDDIPITYVSTTSLGADANYQWMNFFISSSPAFSTNPRQASFSASQTVFTPGWHKIKMIALGGCEFTDSIFISFDCKTCPQNDPVDIIITRSNEVWKNEYRVINGNIYILPGASLEINNCMIYFAPCSKIVVENSSGSGSPGAAASLSIINNSLLLGCPHWKGIEVWGVSDIYDWSGINIDLGRDPRTDLKGFHVSGAASGPNVTNNWAYVYVKNSAIQDADIAIFSGMFDDADPATYNTIFTGGLVFVDGSTFTNNFTDIVFTPRPGISMNSFPPSESWNASYVVRSTFNQNKSTAECTDMYWYSANETTNPWNHKTTNISPSCHIVDLTETQDYTAPYDYYYYNGPGFYLLNFGLSVQLSSTLKRDARIPFTVWHSKHEYNSDRNPYNNIINPIADKISLGLFKNNINTNCNNW